MLTHVRIHVPLLCGLALAAVAPARAQGPIAQPMMLQQAVSEALDHNLDVLAERFNLTIADARIVTAGLRPNPIFSLGADHLDWLGTGYDEINGAGPPEYNARIDFILERGSKRQRRLEVAQAERSVAELELLEVLRTTVFEVQDVFVDALLERGNLELARQNLQTLESIVGVNRARVQAGDLAEAELLRSEVARLQYENDVRQAELRLLTAQLRLRLLLGRQDSDPLPEPIGAQRQVLERPVLVALKSDARRLRPDLLVQQRQQARSRAETRLQMAEGRVDYMIGTEYRRQEGLAGRGNSLGLFFEAALPMFNRNQGEIARAAREELQEDARLRAIQRLVETDVDIAYLALDTAQQTLTRIEQDMLPRARDVRDITDYSYRRGAATFVEFLDAQQAWNETMELCNQARADVARALYAIDAATGASTVPGYLR